MTGFDLLFLASAAISVISLVVAATMAIFGRRGEALRVIRALGLFVVIYFGVSTAVAFLKPQRVLARENPWCFDDWCLAVDRMTEHPAGARDVYAFDLRIVSRARGVSQRALGAWIYLLDAEGRRYEPAAEQDDVPLDVLLAPGEVRQTTRTFALPAGVRPVGLVTGHGGGYCGVMKLLIIGEAGCLFQKPTMIGL